MPELPSEPGRCKYQLTSLTERTVPGHVQVLWSQHALDCELRDMFPRRWLAGVQMPCLEDLVNNSPFADFAVWLQRRDCETPVGQAIGQGPPGKLEAALGRQAGALTAKGALPPLLDSGLTKVQHFEHALAMGARGVHSQRNIKTTCKNMIAHLLF